MRNLKRVLSLAMAAAMLIGMMVISAGAASTYEDFTGKDEIQNSEAVNTMVSLGVINGKDDGSYFDPAGIVTRAEMAALIARCLNGGLPLNTGYSEAHFTAGNSNNTYYLSAPETVSGTVTRYVNSKDSAADKLTIDNTDYTQSSGECKATDLLKAFDVNTMRNMVNNDYTLYLAPFGNVLAYELNKDSVGNFSLVICSGAEEDLMGSLSGKVKLLMADGTKATYSVDLTASAKRFSDMTTNVPSGYSNSDKEKWMADALENGLASADNSFTEAVGPANGLGGQIVTYMSTATTLSPWARLPRWTATTPPLAPVLL